MFSFIAKTPSRANQPGETVAQEIAPPGAGNDKAPAIQSVEASESAEKKLLSLVPSKPAADAGAKSRAKKAWTPLDPSTLFKVPSYAEKRQLEATEAARKVAEKHGAEPYAKQRAILADIVARARSAYPPPTVDGEVASDKGNFGAALVSIRGVPRRLIASSYFWPKSDSQNSRAADAYLSYRIVRNAQHHRFESQFVDNHFRNVDSEAKIVNFIAEKIHDETNASGSIILYTEIAPCISCSHVISEFKAAFPNIKVIVLDNGGNRPNA